MPAHHTIAMGGVNREASGFAAANAKVRLWQQRAEKARLAGRRADAQRCDDKVRDWASRAKQIARGRRAEG
jgi:hypothetical protein